MNEQTILKISDSVSWIGVLDKEIVTFDVVMETKYGTTYNSYYINAQKKAIIETTKEKFWKTYEEKILSVVNPIEIEYIILNHTEPDHSGNLKNLLNIAPNAQIVGSGSAIRYLKDLFDIDFRYIIVKDGDTLCLGDRTLRFIAAPNLHWPDSMYTYLEEEKVLFTCDSFGAHFCDERMFDDLVGDYLDSFKYYFDVILKPFSKFMLKAIDKIKPLEIAVICTGHGPILRSTWQKCIELSENWSSEHLKYPAKNNVFIPFVSAYYKTGLIAEKIADGIKQVGDIDVQICDIENMSLGELDQLMTSSSAVIIGCPTINQNILLPVYKLFSVISPIRDKGKLCGSFGSYGWSGEGKKIINSMIENLKMEPFEDGVFVKFTPNEAEIAEAVNYGIKFAKKLFEPKE